MTYDSGTQQGVNASAAAFAKPKVLELRCQHGLNVLRVDGEVEIATEIADDEGGHVAILDITDTGDTFLRQPGHD